MKPMSLGKSIRSSTLKQSQLDYIQFYCHSIFRTWIEIFTLKSIPTLFDFHMLFENLKEYKIQKNFCCLRKINATLKFFYSNKKFHYRFLSISRPRMEVLRFSNVNCLKSKKLLHIENNQIRTNTLCTITKELFYKPSITIEPIKPSEQFKQFA